MSTVKKKKKFNKKFLLNSEKETVAETNSLLKDVHEYECLSQIIIRDIQTVSLKSFNSLKRLESLKALLLLESAKKNLKITYQ